MNFDKIKDSIVFCLQSNHDDDDRYIYTKYYINSIFLNDLTIERLCRLYCKEYYPYFTVTSTTRRGIYNGGISIKINGSDNDEQYIFYVSLIPVIFTEEDYQNSQEIS